MQFPIDQAWVGKKNTGGEQIFVFDPTIHDANEQVIQVFEIATKKVWSFQKRFLLSRMEDVTHTKLGENSLRRYSEWKKDPERDQKDRQLVEQAKKFLKTKIYAKIPPPSLDEIDIQLVLKWNKPSALDEITSSNIFEKVAQGGYSKHFELGRLLSARVAEKAVLKFFQNYHKNPQDISIQQLTYPSTSDWKKYDLLASNQPLDVKNTRRKFNRNWGEKLRYVEHRVPTLKKIEHDHQDVWIGGALSFYLSPKNILFPEEETRFKIFQHDENYVLFQGIFNQDKLDKLKKWFEANSTILKLDFSHGSSKNSSEQEYFFPAWIYDYPKFLYKTRDKALARLAEVSIEKQIELGVFSWPVVIAAGMNTEAYFQQGTNYAKWMKEFVMSIFLWRKANALSLPFLYLTILTHFLETATNNAEENKDYNPQDYMQLLFEDGDTQYPLFIYDPLETIHALIDTLARLWNANRALLKNYSFFSLKRVGILRGKLAENTGKWQTLIAYCGGWVRGKGICGNAPLLLGVHEHCPECGMLICGSCGFCRDKCLEGEARQKKWHENLEYTENESAEYFLEEELPF